MISAYLDPASGSAIMSAVVAGAAGAGVAAKTMMAKMRLRRGTMEPLPDDEATIAEPVDDTTQ